MSLSSTTFGGLITFTRSSVKLVTNASGVLASVSADTPAFEFDPTTLAAKGLLIEEARTNSIRNNTMVGAVAGTPGTLPTNWTTGTNSSGLAWNVVGTGTENGVTYIDMRLSGTAAGVNESFLFLENGLTAIAAVSGQQWTSSVFIRRTAGSNTNVTATLLRCQALTSGGAGLSQFSGSSFLTTLGATNLLANRVKSTLTLTDATTAFMRPLMVIQHGAGAVDITLRIGMPQLELGLFATSVISTSTVAVTRSADNATITTLAPWFNATEGTLYVEADSFAGTDVDNAPFALSDNTANNLISVITNLSSTNRVTGLISTSGVAQLTGINTPTNSYTQDGSVYKVAIAFKVNDIALSSNIGPTLVTDTSCLIPTVTRLNIGQYYVAGNRLLNGHLRVLRYYPKRLTNSELQALTT